MSETPHYWIAVHPDLSKAVGGVKQIHRLAEVLSSLGRNVKLIQQSADFHPGWFSSNVKTVGLNDWLQIRTSLNPSSNIVILPETFVPGFCSYAPGIPKIIFNQNCAYTFGIPGLPNTLNSEEILQLYSHPELLHVLCVSIHDEKFLIDGFGLHSSRVSRIVNAIETDLFCPKGAKKMQIAFMPRKNSFDVKAVVALLRHQPFSSKWKLQPISGCTQQQVASHLQDSLIFLAFGHPEGFGLPMAEALACGCALVGYSGLGGKELFDSSEFHVVGAEIPFGDWVGFVRACRAIDSSLLHQRFEMLQALLQTSKAVRQLYSPSMMNRSVQIALRRWESQLSSSA